VPALARVLRGHNRVARTLVAWGRRARKLLGVSQRRVEINGQPGALVFDAEGKVFSAFALEIFDGRVQSVRSVVNPDKLRHLGDVADVRAVLKMRDH
jgi:RNA polymerase sigma-70 factor, ECF subfamily